MMSINKLLLPAQQIIHMCWVNARQSPTRHWQTWKPQFVALKGADLCIFESPPVRAKNIIQEFKISKCKEIQIQTNLVPTS